MDPNKALEQILLFALRLQQNGDAETVSMDDIGTALTLADRVIDLHDWIANGGALPEVWRKR